MIAPATLPQAAVLASSPTPATLAGHTAGPWTCFHCGDTFTDRSCAAKHFGRDEGSVPACIIKGAEGGLLRALREAEEQADDAIQMMHAESTDAAKAYHSQRCRHAQALIAAEEVGYERGLRDSCRTDLLTALYQYCGDLRYPPEPDSVKRRLAMIEALIARATGAA